MTDTTSRYVVCPRCEGEGAVDNENFNGFTAADRAEWDDFGASYRRGHMSVPCPACAGKRVMTPAAVTKWEEEEEARWAMEREYRAESLSYALGY